MSYSLFIVYSTVSNASASGSEPAWLEKESLREALESSIAEVKKFPGSFVKGIASLTNSEAASVQVRVAVAICTNLLNRLHLHLKTNQRADTGNFHAIWQKLEWELGGNLNWLYSCFPAGADWEGALPLSWAEEESEACVKAAKSLAETWKAAGSLSPLQEYFLLVLEDAQLYQSLTWRLRRYFQELFAGLQKGNESIIWETPSWDFLAWLTIRNFNHPLLVSSIIRHLATAAEESASLIEGITVWENHRKTFSETPLWEGGLYPALPSLRELVTSAITCEITALQNRRDALTAIYGNTPALPSGSAQNSAILTSLSVGQLAVFCRLFTGCNIVQHSNSSELLGKSLPPCKPLARPPFSPKVFAQNIIRRKGVPSASLKISSFRC